MNIPSTISDLTAHPDTSVHELGIATPPLFAHWLTSPTAAGCFVDVLTEQPSVAQKSSAPRAARIRARVVYLRDAVQHTLYSRWDPLQRRRRHSRVSVIPDGRGLLRKRRPSLVCGVNRSQSMGCTHASISPPVDLAPGTKLFCTTVLSVMLQPRLVMSETGASQTVLSPFKRSLTVHEGCPIWAVFIVDSCLCLANTRILDFFTRPSNITRHRN